MSVDFDFRLASAPFFLIVLPLVVLVLRDLIGRRQRAAIALTGLEYLRSGKQAAANRKKLLVPLLNLMVIVLLGLLWAAPQVQSGKPVIPGDEQTQRKELILAIDVSRSMSGPLELPDREARLAAYGQATSTERRQSRYEVARETVYRFIDRFPDARIGLILFSTEPFLARWPTVETSQHFREILDENLGESSQLRRFSSLTNTDAALRLAKEVFAVRGNGTGGAVIHISDAEDELENMGLAIRSLRSDGIRLYTIGVGISESIADRLMQDFSGDPGFRVFHADSEDEMSDAYRLVAELEESPQYSTEENVFVTDLRWLLALALIVIASVALWILETRFHQTRLARHS
jgi:hypothetical protein